MGVRDRLWDILLYYNIILVLLHAMNAYVRVVVRLQSFSTSAVDGPTAFRR